MICLLVKAIVNRLRLIVFNRRKICLSCILTRIIFKSLLIIGAIKLTDEQRILHSNSLRTIGFNDTTKDLISIAFGSVMPLLYAIVSVVHILDNLWA